MIIVVGFAALAARVLNLDVLLHRFHVTHVPIQGRVVLKVFPAQAAAAGHILFGLARTQMILQKVFPGVAGICAAKLALATVASAGDNGAAVGETTSRFPFSPSEMRVFLLKSL